MKTEPKSRAHSPFHSYVGLVAKSQNSLISVW
jgi:hypothetical protein